MKGTYENGVLALEETPPTVEKSGVVVLFMNEKPIVPEMGAKGVRIANLARKGYRVPDDFNAPLDDEA